MNLDVEGLQGPGDTSIIPTQLMSQCMMGMRKLAWDKSLNFNMCRSRLIAVLAKVVLSVLVRRRLWRLLQLPEMTKMR